jgi:membrane protein DedA with SNARE-associated domain
MGDMIGQLVGWVQTVIAALGYIGVAALIALESLFPPIPSEVILPLTGSLSASGRFNVILAVAAATVGSLVGALLLYALGSWAGEDRIGRWLDHHGKWLLLSRRDLDRSSEWFQRHGNMAVLFARLIPGVRSFISVPAGISEIPLLHFIIFTAVGSALWNSVLIGAGFYLGSNWQQVEGIMAPVGPIVYVLLALAAAVFIGRRLWEQFGPSQNRQTGD